MMLIVLEWLEEEQEKTDDFAVVVVFVLVVVIAMIFARSAFEQVIAVDLSAVELEVWRVEVVVVLPRELKINYLLFVEYSESE